MVVVGIVLLSGCKHIQEQIIRVVGAGDIGYIMTLIREAFVGMTKSILETKIWINRPIGIWQKIKYFFHPWPKEEKSVSDLNLEYNEIMSKKKNGKNVSWEIV